jgi:prepilin-type N-terminal cleavage/methylation domain-containing protein
MRSLQRLGRRGFTLIEMIMVVVIIGIMLMIGLPFFRSSTNDASVRSAMAAMSGMHAVAKAVAISRGRTARLVMKSSSSLAFVVVNKTTGTGVDTVGKVEDFNSRFGVTFATTRDTLTFTPRGIGSELSGTLITFAKGGFTDSLKVTAAGRLKE